MADNLFTRAKKTEVPAKAEKKSKRKEVQLDGLKQLAELDALIKSAGAMHAALSSEVKSEALEIFIENSDGKKPESFRGIDGPATASVECRKRGANSPLSPDEVNALADGGISARKEVVVPQMFGINPKYSADEALLEKISKALEGADVPDDLIVHQEEKCKYVVDDAAVDKAFETMDRDLIEACVTLAIKPKLDDTDIVQIIDDLKSVIAESQSSEANQ